MGPYSGRRHNCVARTLYDRVLFGDRLNYFRVSIALLG